MPADTATRTADAPFVTQGFPSYTIGRDAYTQVAQAMRPFGTKAALVGGKTALRAAGGKLAAALSGSGVELSDPICYGSGATYANLTRLAAMPEIAGADVLFGMGAGQAMDCAKILADTLCKPLFTFPTVASNCAATAAMAVMYEDDGSFRGYHYSALPPAHVFIDTEVLLAAPPRLFWAGIGDACAKQVEVLLATEGRDLTHAQAMGRALCTCCEPTLLAFGEKALADCRAGVASPEFEQVVATIVVTCGLVSNMTISQSAYYNASLAHCFYNAYAKVVDDARMKRHPHGEIVSFGTLVLCKADHQAARFSTLQAFNRRMRLPTTLADLDLTHEDVQRILDVAPSIVEWEKTPYPMTREAYEQAIYEADRAGRELR